jgi:diaminopimelate decarboxylase
MADSPTDPAFRYRNGALAAENVRLADIAAAVGTPFYVYSAGALRRSYRAFAQALTHLNATICYGVKANSNLAVISVLAAEGAGADVVSEGEIRRALAAGVASRRIVFSGVGKTAAELDYALSAGVGQINVESEAEIDMLDAAARARGLRAVCAIRVNPHVDAKSHTKITTGRKQDKFGIALDGIGPVYARASRLKGLKVVGLAVHIGSQLLSLDPYRAAFAKLARAVEALRAAGHSVERLDLGGGLGIRYRDEDAPALAAYAQVVAETVGGLGCALMFEPGRALVGTAGMLVARVVLTKDGGERPIVVLDAAMNDLIRPTLYGAYHPLLPLREPNRAALAAADIVGPICESGDTFAQARPLPALAAGDLVAFGSAGAYGAVMASTYNSRPLVPEVLVDNEKFALIRPRQTYEDMLGQDRLPSWLKGPETDRSARARAGRPARQRGAA